jgi:hypothetical protein
LLRRLISSGIPPRYKLTRLSTAMFPAKVSAVECMQKIAVAGRIVWSTVFDDYCAWWFG